MIEPGPAFAWMENSPSVIMIQAAQVQNDTIEVSQFSDCAGPIRRRPTLVIASHTIFSPCVVVYFDSANKRTYLEPANVMGINNPELMIVPSLKSSFTIVGVRAKHRPNAIDICGPDRGNAGAARSGQSV
jgi:hypothetical protein